ncbi:uncharacterized protein LOC124165860 [Ischnura elegans]|uniref:uncharacterized protein LOC124165860 n=1 Tax=Ischnura elegans TaxID=197161 RepID=UPI001ED8B1E1|nr:uncharacterized protein LOC124165860 [Ischnura elegans]
MRTEGKRRSPFLSFLSKLARPLGRKRAKGSDGTTNCDSSAVVILAPEDDSGAFRDQQRRRESKVLRLSASERSALHRIPEPALPEVDLDLSPCPPPAAAQVCGATPYQGHGNSSCEYDVIRTLAEGCFARVMLARRKNGQPVALKAVHAELTKPKDFYRELHYSIKLGTHQGIVTTYENAAFVVRGSAVVSGGGAADARTPLTTSISRHPSANSGTTSGYASCRLASLERPTPTKGNGAGQLSPQGGHSPSTPGGNSIGGPPLFPVPLPAFYVIAQEVAPLGDLSAHVALWCKAPLWRRGGAVNGASPGVIRGRPSVASIGLSAEGGSPEASVKRAAKQLASALSFMHDAGVVHRDLKLENVLVFAADLSLVKICDLGSARRSGTLVTKVRTTWSAWVPPEVRATLDREHYECRPASDAFQLGLLICTTLAAAANASAAAAAAASAASAPPPPAPPTAGATKAAEVPPAAAPGGSSWWWARRSRNNRSSNNNNNKAEATKGCRRGSVPRNAALQQHRASVTAAPAPLEVQPWSVAEPADPEYSSFIRWQRRRTTKIPARFRRYSARFLRLARRLLDPDPESRSPVSEVYKYLEDPWLDRAYYPASPLPNSAASSTTQATQSVQRPLVRPPDNLRRASVDNRSARSRCGNASPRLAGDALFGTGDLAANNAGKFLTVPQVTGVAVGSRDADDDEEEEFYEFEDDCWDMDANEEDEEEDEEELDPSRRKLRRLLAACGVEGGADRYAQAQKRLWSWVLESQPGADGGEEWCEEGGGGGGGR